MANPSMTDEEIQFRRRAKHRLIGAVALVSGLVVFLPMVLDNEPKPVAEDIAINIPSQDAKPGKAAVAVPVPVAPPAQAAQAVPPAASAEANAKLNNTSPPVQSLTVLPGGQAPKPASAEMSHAEPAKNAKPAAAPAEAVKTAAAPAPPPAAAKPEKPAEAAPELIKPAVSRENKQPAAAAPAAEKAKPATKPAENGAPAQGGFVVRLGAFAKPENAKQLKAKLSSMGIRNYSDVLKTASGDKHRVRAGPYATKREAESVRERLKAVDLVGDVVPKP